MKTILHRLPSIGFSFLFHLACFAGLLLVQQTLPTIVEELDFESVFVEHNDPMAVEDMTRELERLTAPTDGVNAFTGGTVTGFAGGSPSSAIGAGGAAQPGGAPVNLNRSAAMKEASIRPAMTELALPADAMIGEELGEGEIVGEVGAVVEGYGAAMSIITQEIVRMMRKDKVTVLWLFDESGSMEDDRQEIRENYLRVYDELGIVAENAKDARRDRTDQLLTVVASYGKEIHEHTQRPTDNRAEIKSAIDQVATDTSGEENMCRSIAALIAKYRKTSKSRKLALIVVTDESGDDGDYVETAIQEAKAADTPLYFLGRESMFGFPYAHQRWVDEETKEEFWIRIRRGPETPYPECLQWNGLHTRWDVQSSGFGPYEQVRMARETGGIFFVLPGEEVTLTGQGANDKRKYDFLAMRQYEPNLNSRPEYVAERSANPFRETVWQVISRLNPNNDTALFQHHDPDLNIQHEHFPLANEAFRTSAAAQVSKAVKAMSLVNEAIELMEKMKPARASERIQRWRASYDLALAQLHIFRLRLYQYLLAMDRHANNMPAPQNADANEWNFWWDKNAKITPDDAQFERLKAAFGLKLSKAEYVEMVSSEEAAAINRLQQIQTEHAGTPWARRAENELNWGFGFRVGDRRWDVSGRRAEAARRLPNL